MIVSFFPYTDLFFLPLSNNSLKIKKTKTSNPFILFFFSSLLFLFFSFSIFHHHS